MGRPGQPAELAAIYVLLASQRTATRQDRPTALLADVADRVSCGDPAWRSQLFTSLQGGISADELSRDVKQLARTIKRGVPRGVGCDGRLW
jgi:hypothetical protein